GEAMPFLGRRPKGLRENDELLQADADFAGLGGKDGSMKTDEISQVEVFEDFELLVADDVLLSVDLNAAALVFNVDEHAFAHIAMGGNTAGEVNLAILDVIGASVGALFSRAKLVLEGKDAFGLQT